MIPFDALPQNTLPESPALRQPWLSTGLAGGYAVNAFGPRQMATARHTGVGVGSIVRLNDGTCRTVVAAQHTPGVDVTVLTVDEDLPTWCTVREIALFNPVDAMFTGAGRTQAAPVVNSSDVLRGWFWGEQHGTLNWTRSELGYARYGAEDYEVTFREVPGSFAMTEGDSGGGFYTRSADGQWYLQGIGVGIYLYNGEMQVDGQNASQFKPAAPPYNFTYQSSQMLMPRTWLRSLLPLEGDANFDGAVDFNDLLRFVQHYDTAGTWSNGDFTGDGLVDFNDMLVLVQHYTGSPEDLNILRTLVPEPSSLVFGVPLLFGRRRR